MEHGDLRAGRICHLSRLEAWNDFYRRKYAICWRGWLIMTGLLSECRLLFRLSWFGLWMDMRYRCPSVQRFF
ncbi:hypothetical protein GQ55_4G272100 [Panicum hallii var. hallii]|uniref:Uncharacterized protein n=1 Tax=Panicum hallii var. hallii TaxID=1504633 RepID=A0A2T7E0M6_9POAL|nr:hypothetical protein GQ55_4G272100 [Panicum hallii var. hallii]